MNKLTQRIIVALLIVLIAIMCDMNNKLSSIRHYASELQNTLTQDIKSELINQQQTLHLIEENTWELKDVLLDDFSFYMKKLTN